MHTWIFGGGLVRDDDGAVRIVFAPRAARRQQGARQERAFGPILAVGPKSCLVQRQDAASKGSEAGPRAVLRCVPRL